MCARVKRAEFFVERRQLVIAKGARGEREPRRLIDKRLHDARMAMALIDRGIGRQAVQIAPPIHIPDINALSPRQHHVQRLIVHRAEFGLARDKIVDAVQVLCEK